MFELEKMTVSMEYSSADCPPDCDDCGPFDCNPDASCGPDYDWE